MRRLGFIVLILVISVGGSSALFAQNSGTFNGRVVDAAGAVVAGATVTAVDTGTGVPRSTVTNSDGLYTIPALNPSKYDLKAESTGFAPSETKGVTLFSGSTQTVDFTVSVASMTQQVQVSAEAPMVETTTSEVSATLQSSEVRELPMINRNLVGLLALLPGPRESSAPHPAHGYVVIGGSTNAQMMLVDGVDNHEDNDNGAMMLYSLESIQEFKLIAHDFPAEYGKAEGVVLLTTKGGTNQVHGSAFGYGRSDALTKIDYFSDPAHGGVGKAPYTREQFGGSIGGPIKKDKLFYFASVERIQQNYFAPVPQSITALENQIVANFPGIDALAASQVPQPYRDIMIDGKFNWQISANHSAFLRFSEQDNSVTNGRITANHTLLASHPNGTETDYFTTENAAIGETWVINPTTVNQFSAQFIHYGHYDRTVGPGDFAPGGLGACTTYGQNQCILDRMVFPSVSTGIYQSYVFEDLNQKIQIKDDLSKQFGKHAMKFGVDYGRLPKLGGTTGNFNGGAPGSVTWFNDPNTILQSQAQWVATPGSCSTVFNGGTTIDATHCGPYKQGFKTPGAVRTIVETTENPADFGSFNNWDAAGYVQDDFKIKPRFTINLGLRYDIYQFMNQNPTSHGGLPDSRVYKLLVALGNPLGYGTLPQTAKKDFGPRVGFAWDIGGKGKTVVRGSYGIFFWPGTEGNYYTANWFERPFISFGSQYGPDASVGCTPSNPVNPFAGTCPLGTYVYGNALPPGPGQNVTQIPVGQGVGAYWYNGNQFKDQYEQQSHIGISRELSSNMALTVDYTHVLGIHEWDNNDVNPICNATSFQGTCGLPGYPTAANGARPFSTATQALTGDPNMLGFLYLLNSWGRSHFNEVAVHFERRAERMTFQVNYDLSWAYAPGGGVVGGEAMPEIGNIYGGCIYCADNWGPSTNDERHRLSLAGVFQMPLGFQISPAFTVASARPYQLFRGPNPNGDTNLRCFAGTLPVTAATCTTGTQGVTPEVSTNFARGLPIISLSARVGRSFTFHESKKIDAFAEFFNILDRANFGNQYGTSAAAPATFQKPIALFGGSVAGTLANAFQVQFGARFSF